MSRSVVYVETSIPSFYFEPRTEPDMVARRQWTRSWWSAALKRHELVTSPAVMDELERGAFPCREDCLRLLENLPLLAIEEPVLEIVEAYVARRVMPADPAGDALHPALPSFHRCEFLVTWNCRHLANANKFGHIRRVNTLLGLYVPSLVTPLELQERDDEHRAGPGSDAGCSRGDLPGAREQPAASGGVLPRIPEEAGRPAEAIPRSPHGRTESGRAGATVPRLTAVPASLVGPPQPRSLPGAPSSRVHTASRPAALPGRGPALRAARAEAPHGSARSPSAPEPRTARRKHGPVNLLEPASRPRAPRENTRPSFHNGRAGIVLASRALNRYRDRG